jgi:hypothetical protein
MPASSRRATTGSKAITRINTSVAFSMFGMPALFSYVRLEDPVVTLLFRSQAAERCRCTRRLVMCGRG